MESSPQPRESIDDKGVIEEVGHSPEEPGVTGRVEYVADQLEEGDKHVGPEVTEVGGGHPPLSSVPYQAPEPGNRHLILSVNAQGPVIIRSFDVNEPGDDPPDGTDDGGNPDLQLGHPLPVG